MTETKVAQVLLLILVMVFVSSFDYAMQGTSLELPRFEATISTLQVTAHITMKAINNYIYNITTKYMILAGLILYAAMGGGPNEVTTDGQSPLPEAAAKALGLDKLWDWLYQQST